MPTSPGPTTGREFEDGAVIAGEHSRATWTRARMGALAADFDADLTAVLAPYATGGRVSFEVQTRMAWGRPRAHAH